MYKDRLMSKRFAKLTIKHYVIALLLILGWGVQAVQAVTMGSATPQGNMAACCHTADMSMDMPSADGMADCSDHASQHCDMEGSCHSVCLNCPVAVSDVPTVSRVIDKTVFAYLSPVATATPDPIDHPPKRLSSL